MGLGIKQGAEVVCHIEGEDEDAAHDALVKSSKKTYKI